MSFVNSLIIGDYYATTNILCSANECRMKGEEI